MNQSQRGSVLILIIIFGNIAIVGIGAIISLLIAEQRSSEATLTSEQAFQVAEAGINYYGWVLAHNPTDYTGADQDYTDNSNNTIGHFTVNVTPPVAGSSIITLTSTGSSNLDANKKRTVQVRYGKPSYAKFAVLTNTNVWFGENEAVHGRLHSNGGIRMDGVGDSLVTTVKETYICGPEHGCNDEVKPGIWGTGQDPVLWDFPVADAVDFNSITLDFEAMQTAAQNDGIYLGKSTAYGYHIVFKDDSTLTINLVGKMHKAVTGYDGTNWVTESNDIQTNSPITGYQDIPMPDNGLIFVEDQTWVSGNVNGRVTVAAAHLPDDGTATYDIIISDNITYVPDRTSGSVLGLIAQQDILVPLFSPTKLTVDAAMLAQKGHVIRYYYSSSTSKEHAIKQDINTYGTIITNTVWTWTWVNASGKITSGYTASVINYDPALEYSPPPFFPTQDEYDFISWEEIPTY